MEWFNDVDKLATELEELTVTLEASRVAYVEAAKNVERRRRRRNADSGEGSSRQP